MSDQVMPEGKHAIERWMRANEHITQLNRQLSTARSEANMAEEALLKWLLPPDAKAGEKIAVWFGDSLIQAEVGGIVTDDHEAGVGHVTSSRITIRLRGKRLL